MKTVLFSFVLSLVTPLCFGQQFEIRPTVYSGLYSYRGSAAVATSHYYFSDVGGYYNPTSYGKKSDFSYAFELQAQYVTKCRVLAGIGLGYEKLTSRATLDSAYGSFIRGEAVTGKVTIQNTFLTVNPFLGYRILNGPVTLDALVGIEWAHHQNAPLEKAAIASPYSETSTLQKSFHPTDYRHRLQVNATYKRFGVAAGYSRGTINQYRYDNPNFRDKEAFTNFLRLGISYRLM